MIDEVAVIVPAANEEARIGACLTAVQIACDAVAPAVRARVVVVLDRCTDGTAEVVAAHRGVEAVASTARCVGTARRLGTERVLSTTADTATLWIANTDADSLVPPDWLVGMVDWAAAGADLVLGTVLPGPELAPAGRARWLRLHDADDGHRHVHGANLGIRADAMVALGGWRPLATGEDADLVERAVAAGLCIRRTGTMPVLTSARALGRAPEGFSSFLRALG